MKDRINQFLESEQITPTKFADIIGVQRSNISHILSGRNKPSFDFIEKMLKSYPQLNSEWLIMGKGNMYKQAYMPSLFPSNEDGDGERKPIIPAKSDDNQSKIPNDIESGSIAPKNNTKQLPPIESLALANKNKVVERIVVFYSDKTFDAYTPSQSDN